MKRDTGGGTPPAPSLLDAATDALMSGEEAIRNFVLRAPSDLLEKFSSPIEAAESLVGKPEPRAVYQQGLKAYEAGDYTTAADMWTRAMDATPQSDVDVRKKMKDNIDIARSKEK